MQRIENSGEDPFSPYAGENPHSQLGEDPIILDACLSRQVKLPTEENPGENPHSFHTDEDPHSQLGENPIEQLSVYLIQFLYSIPRSVIIINTSGQFPEKEC